MGKINKMDRKFTTSATDILNKNLNYYTSVRDVGVYLPVMNWYMFKHNEMPSSVLIERLNANSILKKYKSTGYTHWGSTIYENILILDKNQGVYLYISTAPKKATSFDITKTSFDDDCFTIGFLLYPPTCKIAPFVKEILSLQQKKDDNQNKINLITSNEFSGLQLRTFDISLDLMVDVDSNYNDDSPSKSLIYVQRFNQRNSERFSKKADY